MGFRQGQYQEKKTKRPIQDSSNIRNNTGFNNIKLYMEVPYVKGISESSKNICRKHDIEMHFEGGCTIKDLLAHPKDKDTILQKSGMIYGYKCGRVDCEEEEYIGESDRTFLERFRKHLKALYPSMTTTTPLVITSPLKISSLWPERTIVLLDPSEKQSYSESMTHP